MSALDGVVDSDTASISTEHENEDQDINLDPLRKEDEEDELTEQIKKAEPKKRTYNLFTEDQLIGKDGIERIYEGFSSQWQFNGRGFEGQDVKRLMNMYKEWAKQLYPGMAFPDMLNRIEQFGSRAHTRNAVMSMRDRERDRFIRDELGGKPDLEEVADERLDTPIESNALSADDIDDDFDELELVRLADEAEQRLKLQRKEMI